MELAMTEEPPARPIDFGVSSSSLDVVFAGLPISMSVRDVAVLLNTSDRTVNRALNEGRLPGHKPLGEWVIFRDELRLTLENLAAARRGRGTE